MREFDTLAFGNFIGVVVEGFVLDFSALGVFQVSDFDFVEAAGF